MTGTVVKGRGPVRTRWMIIGDGPGETDASAGRPFVGRAGKEMDRYLANEGLNAHQFWMTYLIKEYREGNPQPTKDEVTRWGTVLQEEIRRIQPTHIITAGLRTNQYFLGSDITMDLVHGIPHRSPLSGDAVIMPTVHPAAGFYDDDSRTLIAYDFKRAGLAIRRRIDTTPRIDEFAGKEDYRDVTGKQLEAELRRYKSEPIAIDTEGFLDGSWNWSIQVCLSPGTGYTLRCTQPDFARGIAAIGAYCLSDHRPVVVFHNLMHDFAVCRALGLDLFEARVFDTRYAAYVMRVEPQGLKALAYRWCGMKMRSYEETVGDAGLGKQLDYLSRIIDHQWPEPEPRIEYSNDGTSKLYKPQPVHRRAEAIINDFLSDKRDKEGNPVDLLKRWKKVDWSLREMVEREIGPMPVGTLADIPLDEALFYAGRDPDATLRLYHRVMPTLRGMKLEDLAWAGCEVLPVFEEMQDTGMEANRAYCAQKSVEMWNHMCKLQARISNRYNGGRPFNPASPDQVATIMRRRGLVGEKRSKKTGKMSTGKKSIEHLRYTDDAIHDIIEWREHQKMKDSFYEPILEIIGDRDSARIRTSINPYKVVSRRISSSNPNLTAIPVRNDLGVAVRDGFSAAPGCYLGSWDLSQVEMRYMAHESQDELLIRFFKTPGLDVHSETAIRIFKLAAQEIGPGVTPEQRYAIVDEMKHRYPSKRAGFGIITNISGTGLLDQLRMAGCLGWDVEKCNRLVDDWLNVYRGVKRYMDDAVREAEINGFVQDRWGMVRHLPGIWSPDKMTRAEAERAASSMKIQGGAQGMLQNAIRWLKPQLRDLRNAGIYVRWVLQIHDEVIIEADENYIEIVDELVREALTQHHGVNMSIPVKCSGAWARTWGQL